MANLPNDTYQPETLNRDAGRSVLIVTGDNTEDLEFFYPYYRFIEAGYKVDVATPKGGAFAAKHGLGLQHTKKIADVEEEQYALLYLPGGKAPEELRKNERVLDIARHFADNGKLIAAICHGPQILAAADVIKGKKIAAWPEIEKEVQQAGGNYVNREVVTDGVFTTARWPGDLPAHMKAALAVLKNSEGHGMLSSAA